MLLLLFFFNKYVKFRIQARLCLAVFDFEAHIILSLGLTFQGAIGVKKI